MPGAVVTPRMHEIINSVGPKDYLSTFKGGQELQKLYGDQSRCFDNHSFDAFARACFSADIATVLQMVVSGAAPPLNNTVTEYKFGYITLAVHGSQRLIPQGKPLPHVEMIKLLLSLGCPPDIPDICRFTALLHAPAIPNETCAGIVRALAEGGANLNHTSIYGSTAIALAMMSSNIPVIDVLMELGARIDMPDGDGLVLESHFVRFGPSVTAVVSKWLRRRNGEEAPLEERACGSCGKMTKDGIKLSKCASCRIVMYCSKACQQTHWKKHKSLCTSFTPENTVTLIPFHHSSAFASLMPTTTAARNLNSTTGTWEKIPEAHTRYSQEPKSYPKSVIIKIQNPYFPELPPDSPEHKSAMLVHTKKRDFVCRIRRQDNPKAYDRVFGVIRAKGPGGAKAYFAAELKSPKELVVQVDKILAEQPF